MNFWLIPAFSWGRGIVGITRLCAGLLLAVSLSSFAQTGEAPLSKDQKIQALRKALGNSGGSSESTAKKKPVKPAEPVDFRSRAMQELKAKEQTPAPVVMKVPAEGEAIAPAPAPVIATVHTTQIETSDPVLYQGLQIGLTLQRYQPQGTIQMINLGARDLGALSPAPMLGLELRYMPFTSEWLGHHAVGFRFTGAYSSQPVKLQAKSGKDLGPTRLHSMQSMAYLSQDWVFVNSPKWGWSFDAGFGHFDMIQTGQSSSAQSTSGIWLAGLRTGPSYRLGSLWLNLNYEYRKPMSRGWASLNDSGILVGLQYGIR